MILPPGPADSSAPSPKPGSSTEPRGDSPTGRRRLRLGDSTAVDSEALTQSEVVDAGELAPGQTAERPFDAPPNKRSGGGRGSSGDLEPPRLPTASATDPDRAWQSDSSRRISQLGLVVLLAVFGLIGCGIAFAFFVRSYLRDTPTVVAQATGQPDPVESIAAPEPPATGEPESESENATPSVETPAEDDSPDLTGSPDSPPPADPLPAASTAATAESSKNEPPITPQVRPVDSPANPGNALISDFMPEVTRPIDAGGDPSAATDTPGSIDALPPGLRRFIPLTDPSTAGLGPPRVFDTPPTIHSIPMERAAEDLVEENPLVPKVVPLDIPKLMGMRVAIQQQDVPLAELTLLVSQLTTVPVELELISLDVAGIAVTRPCETPSGWMPIGQWLDQTLAPLGLVAEPDENRLLIRATTQRLQRACASALVLDDFGPDAESVANWVRPVIGPVVDAMLEPPPVAADAEAAEELEVTPIDPALEDAWNYVREEQRIALPADRSAWIRAVLVVEAARLARGIPPRLERWRTARWVGSWDLDAQAAADDEAERPHRLRDWPAVVGPPSGATTASPRALAGLLREFAAEHQIAITVAWMDALRHQVTPGDLVMPLMDGLPVGEVLDDLIGEAGLQARDAGGSVWWVGSDANYDRYEVITWLHTPEEMAPLVLARLATSLGLPDATALNAAASGDTLLIRVPRFVARQLFRFSGQ
ncbi:MAG: hypothetical protein EA381_02700 [Planctomycetaceae bacterium]|nr:MAG: hypothetical protein EA381_02700 [Planctomycetaceae bacterium]